MQFIRLPKAIDIAERLLPELVADWMNTKIVQNIDISFVQKLQVNKLISWVVKSSKSWVPHRRTFRNFTHRAWAIWDLSNHDLFWIIPDPGSQKRITLSLESISKIPFQARASDVKIPEWGQQCSNHGMPCLVSIFGTFRATGDQPNKNPGALFRCTAGIFSIITDHEIQRPGMLVSQTIGQVGLGRCTTDWHNRPFNRKLMLRIPPPIACVQLTVYSVTFWVCKVHQFKIEVCLKWERCQKRLYTFESIHVVQCSEDVRMIFNPTIVPKPEIEFREELS